MEKIVEYLLKILKQYPGLNGSITLHFNNGKWVKSELRKIDK